MSDLLLTSKNHLAWNEYGTPNGEPVFYFHGMPGSRLEAQAAHSIACDLGVRLIAPERPGYGGSDPQKGFQLLDWPDAISQLADKLNINRFSILGFSGGGAYALACTSAIPDRLKGLTLVGCPAPFETEVMQNHVNADFKPLYELSANDYDAAIQQASQMASSPAALLAVLQAPLPAADQGLFKQRLFHEQYLENLTLAINNGVNGIVNDLRCLAQPWLFNLEDIQIHVDIWHGRNDHNIGFAIAEYLADTLENTSTHYWENSGHCFVFAQWREVLERTITKRPVRHDVAI